MSEEIICTRCSGPVAGVGMAVGPFGAAAAAREAPLTLVERSWVWRWPLTFFACVVLLVVAALQSQGADGPLAGFLWPAVALWAALLGWGSLMWSVSTTSGVVARKGRVAVEQQLRRGNRAWAFAEDGEVTVYRLREKSTPLPDLWPLMSGVRGEVADGRRYCSLHEAEAAHAFAQAINDGDGLSDARAIAQVINQPRHRQPA